MKDLGFSATRIRRWGYVALAFAALPAVGLAYRGLGGPIFNLLVPMVILGVVGAAMVAMGIHMPRALAAGADPATLPELRASSFRRPATLVVGLGAFSLVFSVITTPLCACTTREKAYEAAMKSDLRNLQSAQEIHWAEHEGYTSRLAALDFTPSHGVGLVIRAGPDGWSARTTHAQLEGVSCVIRSGVGVEPLRTLSGRGAPEPHEVFCDP